MTGKRDRYHSRARDETNLTEEIRLIITGESVDLRQSVRRAAFMGARLGQANVQTLRSLLRAALTVSPHPMSGHFLEKLHRRGVVVWDEDDEWEEDEIEFAVRRHAEWLEEKEPEALASAAQSQRLQIEHMPPAQRLDLDEDVIEREEEPSWLK